MSHIAVERNRRRQMNEHLKVLRSLTPCFYIKRVCTYIYTSINCYDTYQLKYIWFTVDELKGDQASIIGGVIEFIKELHQVVQSLEAKKRRKSLSPSPGRQFQPPDSPFGNMIMTIDNNTFKELGASCNSPVADVEAKISGSNVLLRTISKRIPGQVVRIIAVLEKLSFEILHLNISTMEDTVLYSFVIKVYPSSITYISSLINYYKLHITN